MFLSNDDGKPLTIQPRTTVVKATVKQGDFASWNSSGGKARGSVERIMTEGVLNIPETSFKINAQEDDPAVLLRLYRPSGDGWRKTPTMVGHKMSTLTKIEPLKIAVEKATFKQGDFAQWNSSGGTARGSVERILTEGVLNVPDSSFKINAEEDDPAVLLRVYRKFGDGWRETPTRVGHKMSTLTKIEPLKSGE